MWFFNALLRLFILLQDFMFSFRLFHTLSPILDKQYYLLVVQLYFCVNFFGLLLCSFSEKLLVIYDCILCANFLLIALYIVIQVCYLTSWKIVNMSRL